LAPSALAAAAAARPRGAPAPPPPAPAGASAGRGFSPLCILSSLFSPLAPALRALFFSSEEGTLRLVFSTSLLGLLLLLLTGPSFSGRGGANDAPLSSRPSVALPPTDHARLSCDSVCGGGANVSVRVPIVHPSQKVGYGFSDSNRTRPFNLPDDWGISYNIGPGVPAASALQIPCGVLVFSDVTEVRSDYFFGRVVVMQRAAGAVGGAPELDLRDHNFDEVLAAVEGAPPPPQAGCADNASATARPPAPGGGRPVYFYVETGPRSENMAHWEGETGVFLERWRCVRAHYPTAKLLLEHRSAFKTMLLSALFGLAEGDVATVRMWDLTNGGAGAGGILPCERGNVVVLPPLMMLNQWTTDLPMQGALVARYFAGYAARFGQAPGCPAVPPTSGGPGALLMLPHGRVSTPEGGSLEDMTRTIDVEFQQTHHRNTSYEAPVLDMVKKLGGTDFYGNEANNARLQLEVLRRARVVVTSYGTSMFHNALLARGATFIVMVGHLALHHVLMPTFGEWVKVASQYNKFHFIMGPFDTARVRELTVEALAQPPLPCPIPSGESVTWSGCMKRNKDGPYESSFGVCE
jgi:hypothetical protein